MHGHPDKLSISIHDGRKEILPDLGTTAYGVPDCYAWYQKTISHNTVTVDRKNQNAVGERFPCLNLLSMVENRSLLRECLSGSENVQELVIGWTKFDRPFYL